MTAFGRAYELKFSPTAGDDLVLVQDKGRSKIGLAIEFTIEKKATREPQTASFKIMNPSDKTVAAFQSLGVLEFKAGYQGDVARIFRGMVRTANVDQNGVDTALTLDCLSHVPEVQVGEYFPKGTTNLQVVKSLSDSIIKGTPSVNAVNPFIISDVTTYNEPTSIANNAYNELDRILKPMDYQYFVENGILTIRKAGEPLLEQPVSVSAKTGMIGFPKKIAEVDDKGKIRNGVEFQSLLNYALSIGRRVILQSKAVSGTFTIDSLTFRGNSFEGDWISEVRCLNNG